MKEDTLKLACPFFLTCGYCEVAFQATNNSYLDEKLLFNLIKFNICKNKKKEVGFCVEIFM